ncbi:MAG: hypothetical protein HZA93_14210 [Verrucomicrobia bacterium]|nr:hypothetical protein [Verrucomicrobiota bacterium]
MRDCLRPEYLPAELQQWFLMDAHLRLLQQRFAASIHAMEERLEFLRVTRPPFFQVQKRQLAISEEQRIAAQELSAQRDAHLVDAAAKKLERVIVVKFSALILALDPASAPDAGAMLHNIRNHARLHWLDEEQNDQAFAHIREELAKLEEPPPETPVVASLYGHDEHPKAVPAGDPWANAAD